MCRRHAVDGDGDIGFAVGEWDGGLVWRRVGVGVAKVSINAKPVTASRGRSVNPDSSNILFDPRTFCPQSIVSVFFFLDELWNSVVFAF